MTIIAANLPPDNAPVSAGGAQQSFLRRMLGTALVRWGARVGVVWVAMLIFAAVFAPFLANSHPVLLKMDGRWSSPLLHYLAPGDAALLLLTLASVVLLCLRHWTWLRRALWLLGLAVVIVPAAFALVHPPEISVYEQYRDLEHQRRVQFVLRVPLPFSPNDRLRDQPGLRLTAPSLTHPLGTTVNGADMLANMVYGARIALTIGLISTGIAIVIGVMVGGLMGYCAGWVDLLGMRLVEIFDAIPTLYLLLAFVAFFGANLYIMMAIIGVTGWVGYAHYIRAEFLKLRQQEFVQAAHACGLPLWSILFKHMLPNGITPVLVSASFGVAGAILAESTLSFLGIGLAEEASWGNLLNQALGVGGTFYWWIAIFPGLAIFLTVFAYNLIGEALRDAIDPRAERTA